MTSITTWDGFADATLTGQDSARRMGREPAAGTPPVRLARRARRRKPNRRPLLPLWAGAMLITLQAKTEMQAATARRNGGTR